MSDPGMPRDPLKVLANRAAYRAKPETREYNRRYQREYKNKPEVRERLRNYMREYLADPANRARRDEVARARRFGITVERLREVLAPGRCGACGAAEPGGKYDWHIDHDHVTGEVRDMLCHGCNTGLGALRDNPNRVRAVLTYIEKHQPQIEFCI